MQPSITLESPSFDTTRRTLSAPALAVGLFFSLVWPPVVGIALGLAGWLWFDDSSFLKLGVTLGIVVGCLISLSFLLGSLIYTKTYNERYVKNPQMVNYVPLGSAPGEDMRIIPLRAYDKLIDKVPQRDIAWFVLGLSRGMKHSQRTWLGKRAPSNTLVDPAYWYSLCQPLRKAEIIKGAGERHAGTLTTRDRDKMLTILGMNPWDSDLWLNMPDPTA
jgi:hypothetical protein